MHLKTTPSAQLSPSSAVPVWKSLCLQFSPTSFPHLHSLLASVLLAIALVIDGAFGIFLVHPLLFDRSTIGDDAASLFAAFRPSDWIIENRLRGNHFFPNLQRLAFLVWRKSKSENKSTIELPISYQGLPIFPGLGQLVFVINSLRRVGLFALYVGG